MMPSLSHRDAFMRYQEILPRLRSWAPASLCQPRGMHWSENLSLISDAYDVFVFDAYGVLNVGADPINGASACIDQLRAKGKQVIVLTNAASFNRSGVFEKFRKLGFNFSQEELVSSRAVCEAQIGQHDPRLVWGVIAPSRFDPSELAVRSVVLGDDPELYKTVDGFLFLSSECWGDMRQSYLRAALSDRLRPVVVANPDLVAPQEYGLSIEPGYFAHELMDQFPDLDIEFHGKPFPSVYDRVEALLGNGVSRDRIVMMGDTLHTDILGANMRGWGSVLVTGHGFLKGQDVEAAIRQSGIVPDWLIPSI